MGAEFSLVRLTEAASVRVERDTRTNTRHNRSVDSPARLVALTRLAARLAALGAAQRRHVIRLLRLSPRVMAQVRRRAPAHVFRDPADRADRAPAPRALADVTAAARPPASSGAANAGAGAGTSGGGGRRVSFAKVAELRFFVE